MTTTIYARNAAVRRPGPQIRWPGHRLLLALASIVLGTTSASAQVVPSDFVDEIAARGLTSPTALAFAPDGRLVITEQGGTARLVVRGVLQPAAFARLTVDSVGERGLLGVAFHPNFVTNGYVYFYHTEPAVTTAPTRPAHNRVTRFTVSGDAVLPESATTILTLESLTAATNHNGGGLQFGKDGKLYVSVGENNKGANAGNLANRLGKILRLNADGTIPADNPTTFAGVTGNTVNAARAIWAIGLRNPFTFAFHPHTGQMIINDVGEKTFEELNRGVAGANYGWPNAEGVAANASYTNPIYYYAHLTGTPRGCAVSGGAFYRPAQVTFPASYVGRYFFTDYCGNWIYSIDPANPGAATLFASGLNAPVGLAVGSGDGALYYLQRGTGELHRIRYTGTIRQRLVVTPQQFELAETKSQVVSVRLESRPAANVTVKTDRTLSDYLITSTPSSFVFTPANWDQPQSLTVTAQADGDAVDEGARISLWSPGIPSVRVRVTAVDDDRPAGAPRAIISRPRPGDIVSGATAEFFGDGQDDGSLVRGQFIINNVVRFTDTNLSGHYHLNGDHNLWNTTVLPNGDYTLRLTVTDALGKIGSHEVRVRVAN